MLQSHFVGFFWGGGIGMRVVNLEGLNCVSNFTVNYNAGLTLDISRISYLSVWEWILWIILLKHYFIHVVLSHYNYYQNMC